jgi:hypothetical protein
MCAIRAALKTIAAEEANPHGKAIKETAEAMISPRNFIRGERRWRGELPDW